MEIIDTIINGDVRDILKTYPDNFFDCVVSDVPYKIKTGGARTHEETIIKYAAKDPGGCFSRIVTNDKFKNRWLKQNKSNTGFIEKGDLFEHCSIKFEEWLPDVYRVTKNDSHVYFMVNDTNLKDLWQKAENAGFIFQTLLVWKKNNKTPNKYYMKQAEFILFMRKGHATNINNMGMSNIFEIPNIIGTKKHPTEKPVKLMESFILQSTKENDTVLDMFCGSGSTLAAAKKNNRHYVGIDLDKTYIEISKNRLSEVNKKTNDNNIQIKIW